MATYEDMVEGEPPYRVQARTPYAETLSTINEADSQYDIVSIPSARRVHAEMVANRERSNSNPFADPSDDDNPQSPLFRGFPRWYGRSRSGTGATSPGSESSASIAPAGPSSARWGALSPTSVSSRSTSRVGNFSPVPADRSSSSRGTPSRSQSRFGVDSSSGQEYSSDGGGVQSGSDWERISEDPFADPNKRGSYKPLPRVGGGRAVVYSSLLPKVSRVK